MHLVAPLAAGVKGAEGGTAYFYARGTSTPATYYTDFEASSSAVVTTGSVSLDANGGAIAYVSRLCTVVVKNSSGTTVRTFVAGDNDDAVEVISQSFTGTDYVTASRAASKPTTLGAVLDLWKTNAGNASGSIDWKVSLSGTSKTLASWLSGFAGLVVNVKDVAYGATGDGTTDDSSAIASACLAAANGGVVVFPPGTYKMVGSSASNLSCSIVGLGAAINFANNAVNFSWFDSAPASISAGATTYPRCYVVGMNFAVSVVGGVGSHHLINKSGSANALSIINCEFTSSGAGYTGRYVGLRGTGSDLESAGDVISGCRFYPDTTQTSVVYVTSPSYVVRDCVFGPPSSFTGDLLQVATSTAAKSGVIAGNMFDNTEVAAGTITDIVIEDGSAAIRDNIFAAGGGGTIRAIEADSLSAGAILSESGNHFGSGITRYVYNTADRDNVSFGTRELPVLGTANVSVSGGGTSNLAADQYGTIYLTSTTAAHTVTFSVGCLHQKFRLIVFNNTGGGFTLTFSNAVATINLTTAAPVIAAGRARVMDFVCITDAASNYEWLMVNESNEEVAI